jgi:hypothetical protein
MRARCFRHLILVAFLVLTSCGGTSEPGQPGPGPAEPWVNKKPVTLVCSPGELAVGEKLTLLGDNYVDPAHGKAVLQFQGTFFDSEGNASPVDLQTVPQVNVDNKTGLVKSLVWEMYPSIVFDPAGNRLGRFVGNVTVLNQGKDGSQQVSDPFTVAIDITPSILVRLSRPANAGCDAVVTDTLENQPMQLEAEVVGLRPGTEDAPLVFHWTFLTEQWKVGLESDPSMDPSWKMIDPAGFVQPKAGPVTLEHTVTDGAVSQVGEGLENLYVVKASTGSGAAQPVGMTRVKALQTGSVAEQGNSMPITANLGVVDASGKSVKVSIRLTIHRIAELIDDKSCRLAEYFPPRALSGCTPGGDFGTDVTYQESQSEREDRSVSYNWNANYGHGFNIGYWGGFNASYNYSVNKGFGFNMSESVSSDQSVSRSINKHILPGQYGMMFRQKVKMYRIGQMVANTECGEAVPVGEVVLTDWTWSAEVATGSSCPPPSGLPHAQAFDPGNEPMCAFQ